MTQAVEISQNKRLTTEISVLFPRQGEWTETDYFRLPETNQIVELSKGVLIISPAPKPKHQKISLNLSYLFTTYVRSHKLGELAYAPLDVRLWEGNIRQPDIAFMSNEHLNRITEELWGIPDLVVEILSEGTAKIDKEDKFQEYERAGVLEYWIIDSFKQSVEIYTLENGIYELFGKWGSGEITKSKLFDEFEVSVDDVMV
jgi:Uma2 family endonuclease